MLRNGPHKVAILADSTAVKALSALFVLLALFGFATCGFAAARTIPLPRPRPAEIPEPPAEVSAEEPAPPSACRLRLTAQLAVAPSLPALVGGGECNVEDVVRLEAVWLADKSSPKHGDVRVAILDVEVFDHGLRSCRDMIELTLHRHVTVLRMAHGKANALDVRSVKLASGSVIELTDPSADKSFRERVRKSTCARFTTVLGPGSDGYHENHIHVDLAERAGGHRMCQWDVREPGEEAVPLPQPRPTAAP